MNESNQSRIDEKSPVHHRDFGEQLEPLVARAFREPQESGADIQALLRVIAEDPRYREGGAAEMIILVKRAITVAAPYRDFPLSYRKVRERLVTEAIEAYYSGR